MDEIWKPIPGLKNYEVSNKGAVRSWNVVGSTTGGVLSEPRLMRIGDNGRGYKNVKFRVCGRIKTFYVHRLVAEAFIPNPFNLPQVNHRDENKGNNFVYVDEAGSIVPALSNLEWCDGKYNLNYGTVKRRIGDKKRGRHLSEKTRRKISEATKGEKHHNFGKSLPEETRQKISQSLKGLQTGDKNPFYGRHHSDNTKRKISNANKGRLVGEKNPMFGKSSMAGKSADEIRQINARKSKSLKAFYARKIADKENQS